MAIDNKNQSRREICNKEVDSELLIVEIGNQVDLSPVFRLIIEMDQRGMSSIVCITIIKLKND